MRCRLFDASGNRILWLDSRDCDGSARQPHYEHMKAAGVVMARRFAVGQDLTAVLFGSSRGLQALFWNPDGSFEMTCGNAIRCLAHVVCEDAAPNALVSVETPCATYLSRKIDTHYASAVIPGRSIRVVQCERHADLLVDVGTPHRIRLVNQEWPAADLAAATFFSTGRNAVNFSLVRRIAPGDFRVRTFERGVGETSSCGTAATSIVAALEVHAAPAAAQRSHHVEFASGEHLTVTYDASLQSYEIGGRVALLRDWTA